MAGPVAVLAARQGPLAIVRLERGLAVVRLGENTAEAARQAGLSSASADAATASAAAAAAAAGYRVSIAYSTWSALSAITGTAGQSGAVFGDAGTHTDPVVGGTVSNSGVFAYSTSPAGWKRLADLPPANAIAQGLHTIPVLAGAMTPRTTNGPSFGSIESATNKVMTTSLDFDPATAEYAQISLPMPKSYNGGTISLQFIWSAAGTGNVVWAGQAQFQRDDDPLDGAWGTAVTVTDGVTATTDRMISAFTAAITPAGTWAAESSLLIQLYRDATNGSDTINANDARLLAIRVKYTINAADDT